MSAATSSLVTFEDAIPLHQPPPLCRKEYVTITDSQFEISRAGYPMWTLTCEPWDGRSKPLRTWISFAPNALPITKKRLAILAPYLTGATFRPDDIQLVGALVGVRALVVVRREWGVNEDTGFSGWNRKISKVLKRV